MSFREIITVYSDNHIKPGSTLCGQNETFLNVEGRAIAQAVSRWLPTAAAWILARVKSCGICGGQSGTGAGFLQVLSTANLHSTNCSTITIIYHLELVQ
jgi:hypothetical protein